MVMDQVEWKVVVKIDSKFVALKVAVEVVHVDDVVLSLVSHQQLDRGKKTVLGGSS